MKEVHKASVYYDAAKIVVVCILWYLCSTTDNIIGKIILSEFPYPMTITMVQLATAAILLGPIISTMDVPSVTEISRRYYFTMILPLAMGKFLSSVSSYVSIWKSSVSYAHTVKATLPMFTVILSRLILGETQTMLVYLSLLPIMGGVVIATVTELAFDYIGLGSALFATLCFSLQTIFSKMCLKDTGLHHMRLLVVITRISTVCFLPLWVLFDLRRILHDEQFLNSNNKLYLITMLMFDGLCNMGHNIFAFTLLSMVTSLSYAVANATKRIFIISGSLMVLKNPVTPTNILGMLVAIFGVLSYNKAKYDQNQAIKRAQTLPYVRSEPDFLKHNTGLPHSKSDVNLYNSQTQQNGHILLREWHNNDHVTIIPIAEKTPEKENYSLRPTKSATTQAHARVVHHV
ncbi:solute carrier family 35 member E1 homolog [Haliotis rubra]|uniref:solute carrier family 35 member E1 homolog n=1 Tax=Haliotis rubra TaxID=36100 RepID=UPI001EE55FC1|nr:solute carrier family 35 member E1 homolog [Haliotis rubra]